MDGAQIKAMVSELAPVIREYVDAANAPLLERIASLEADKTTLANRCSALEEAAAKPVEIDLTPVEKLIEAEIAKLPEPQNINADELLGPLAERVSALEAAEPIAGPPGEKGDPGEPGKDGADGEPGKDGADGRGIKDLLIDREGHLIATMDDGSTKNLGPIIGKDGAPGKDGRDGFGLEDFDCVPVDERTVKMEFVRGETKHSYELQFPVVVYRGVFKEGAEYERGDMVTWAGSLWHCDTPTKDKPGTENWTLAAKKGRDGKDLTKNG